MRKYTGWIVLGLILGTGWWLATRSDCDRGRDNLSFMEICSVTPGCVYDLRLFKQTAVDLNACPNGIDAELAPRRKKETKGAIL